MEHRNIGALTTLKYMEKDKDKTTNNLKRLLRYPVDSNIANCVQDVLIRHNENNLDIKWTIIEWNDFLDAT